MSELGEEIVKAVTEVQKQSQEDRIISTWGNLLEKPPQNLPVTYLANLKKDKGYLPTEAEPTSIPLNGGGKLKFGLCKVSPSDQRGDLTMEVVNVPDSKGERHRYPPFIASVRYGMEWKKFPVGVNLTQEQSDEVDRFLALFKPQVDIDLLNASSFSPEQKAILETLEVKIPE